MLIRYFYILLMFLFISCSNNCIEPEEISSTEKLYPYDVVYDQATFKDRRDQLIQNIDQNSIVLLVTNDTYLRNGTVDYIFRPSSDYYYFTGFDEPNTISIIRQKTNSNESELIMFVEYREEGEIQWLGPVEGISGVMENFYADTAFYYDDFSSMINEYIEGYTSIYTNLDINQTVSNMFNISVQNSPELKDISDISGNMRNIKSPLEISLIQSAVDVSVQAFKEALKSINPNMYEYEIEATFDYITSLNGCPNKSFPTIVASGPNINILHYQNNTRKMEDGDLVMIDFGAEYGYYASDITRTIPVSGKFTEEQATIYNIVLEAHKNAIDSANPGVGYYDLYWQTVEFILEKLIDNDIVEGNKDNLIASGDYKKYIVAGLGHCIGLDVHDPFPREPDGDKILQENMVLAFEPHVYLYEGDQTVNEKYWGISARHEDDILITETGAVVLSQDLPIEINEIENLMEKIFL